MSGNIDRKHGLAGGLFLLSLGIGVAACAGEAGTTEQLPPTGAVAGSAATAPAIGTKPVGSATTAPTTAATTASPTTATAAAAAPAGTAAATTAAAPGGPAATAGAAPATAGAAPGMAPAGATTAPAGGVATYQHDIRPIMEARCVGCHVAGGVGPFPLDTWESVDKVKAAVIPAVTSHRMPPWPADDSNCTKQRNKQRLSDEQIALFTKWQTDGFMQGAPTEFAPLVEEEPARATSWALSRRRTRKQAQVMAFLDGSVWSGNAHPRRRSVTLERPRREQARRSSERRYRARWELVTTQCAARVGALM